MTHETIIRTLRVFPEWIITDSSIGINYYLNGQIKYFACTPMQMAKELLRQGMVIEVLPMCCVNVKHHTPEGIITSQLTDFVEQFDQIDWIKFLREYEVGKMHREEFKRKRDAFASQLINDALRNN